MKRSGSVMVRTRRPRPAAVEFARSCSTIAPNPPLAPCSTRDQRLVMPQQAARSGRSPAAWQSGHRPPSADPPAPPTSAACGIRPDARRRTGAPRRTPSRSTRPLPISSTAALRHLDANAFAARIAEGDRPGVMRGGRGDHVHQLGLVARGHDHQARQVREEADVEGPGMGRTVGPTSPARSMAKRTGRFCSATSCTIWS